MLKLKGQTESGESSRIKCDHCGQCFDIDVTGVFSRCDNCQTEVQINIQPADDPRKAMLEEILAEVQAIDILGKIQTSRLTGFLLEMEAKL